MSERGVTTWKRGDRSKQGEIKEDAIRRRASEAADRIIGLRQSGRVWVAVFYPRKIKRGIFVFFENGPKFSRNPRTRSLGDDVNAPVVGISGECARLWRKFDFRDQRHVIRRARYATGIFGRSE